MKEIYVSVKYYDVEIFLTLLVDDDSPQERIDSLIREESQIIHDKLILDKSNSICKWGFPSNNEETIKAARTIVITKLSSPDKFLESLVLTAN